MADPDRRGAANLYSPRRAPDGEVRVGGRQSPSPEDGARGGERGPAEFHRDENRGDGERASLENDAGAEIERRRRAGNSAVRDRDAEAAPEGVSGVFFRLRDLSGRRPTRRGEDRLPQGLIERLDPRRNFFAEKNFRRKKYFRNRGIIIAPHPRCLYTRSDDSSAKISVGYR